jgi:hypothetical protein
MPSDGSRRALISALLGEPRKVIQLQVNIARGRRCTWRQMSDQEILSLLRDESRRLISELRGIREDDT